MGFSIAFPYSTLPNANRRLFATTCKKTSPFTSGSNASLSDIYSEVAAFLATALRSLKKILKQNKKRGIEYHVKVGESRQFNRRSTDQTVNQRDTAVENVPPSTDARFERVGNAVAWDLVAPSPGGVLDWKRSGETNRN